MSQRVLPYMMSLHIGLRPVFLAALPAGYSSSRLSASSEGDSSPTHGGAFAREISRWVRASVQGSSLRLLCSTQPSAVEAAQVIATESGCISPTHRSGLNPLDTGEEPRLGREARIASMGFSERHLGGESFADLVRRLEPCVLDIEASMEPVLILAHGTPCRALRAYFMRIPVVECMGAASSPAALALTNASNCVVELRPSISGRWTEHIHQVGARTSVFEKARTCRSVWSI
jgi:broad specificity phosphatase PhoE